MQTFSNSTVQCATDTARAAMAAIARKDPDYWAKTIESRIVGGLGSNTTFDTVAALTMALITAAWEPYQHEALGDDVVAFITRSFGGKLGVLKIRPEDTLLLVDLKGTGAISGKFVSRANQLDLVDVDYTVLITGLEDGERVAFTFHPGPPIAPSRIQAEGNIGREITGAEAIALGLVYGKL